MMRKRSPLEPPHNPPMAPTGRGAGAALLPGVEIAMGGQTWIVPPLTLGQLRRLLPQVQRLSDFGATMGEAEIDVIVDLVTAALQRNYPEMTPTAVANLVDLGNARAVVTAILTGSGLGSAVGEDEPPGPARGQPATTATDSAAFTASSPPAADTRFPSSMR
jgi:hypothetical protein